MRPEKLPPVFHRRELRFPRGRERGTCLCATYLNTSYPGLPSAQRIAAGRYIICHDAAAPGYTAVAGLGDFNRGAPIAAHEIEPGLGRPGPFSCPCLGATELGSPTWIGERTMRLRVSGSGSVACALHWGLVFIGRSHARAAREETHQMDMFATAIVWPHSAFPSSLVVAFVRVEVALMARGTCACKWQQTTTTATYNANPNSDTPESIPSNTAFNKEDSRRTVFPRPETNRSVSPRLLPPFPLFPLNEDPLPQDPSAGVHYVQVHRARSCNDTEKRTAFLRGWRNDVGNS